MVAPFCSADNKAAAFGMRSPVKSVGDYGTFNILAGSV